jgi:hypothetical protein
LGTEKVNLLKSGPGGVGQHALELIGSNDPINERKDQVDDKIEDGDNQNEFPPGQIKHAVENAEPFPEWHTFLLNVKTPVTVDEPATNIIGIVPKAGIIVQF